MTPSSSLSPWRSLVVEVVSQGSAVATATLKVSYAAVHKPACSLFTGIFSLRRRFQWPWPAFQELKHSGVAASQLCSLRMQWILGAMLRIPSQSSSSGFWSYSQFPVAAALDSTRSIVKMTAGQLCSLAMQWVLGAVHQMPCQPSSSGFCAHSSTSEESVSHFVAYTK